MNGKSSIFKESTISEEMRLKIKRYQFVPARSEFSSSGEPYRFWAFVAGLSFPGYHIGLNTMITSIIGKNSIDTMLAYCILLGTFLVAFVKTDRRRLQYYIKPLVFLLMGAAMLFIMSGLIWPNNAQTLKKMVTTFFQTAVWGGIAINMIDDVKLVKKAFRLVGYIIFVCLLFEPFAVNSTLFIEADNSWGSSGYITWGYRMMVAAILLIYAAFDTKRKIDVLCATIASFEIMLIGNRGATVAIFVFIVMYVLFCAETTKRIKYIVTFGCLIGILVSWLSTSDLVQVKEKLENVGVESRNISKILGDTITESGRVEGYLIAIEQIVSGNNWTGLGVGGDEVLVGNYPHNILLELLLQYGNIAGSIIFAVLVFYTIRALFYCKNRWWKSVFITCFSLAIVKLCFSSTYWYELWFWAYLVMLHKVDKIIKYDKYYGCDEYTCEEKKI